MKALVGTWALTIFCTFLLLIPQSANSATDIHWVNIDWTRFTVHEGNHQDARTIVTADMDNDGDLDVLSAAYDANDITWWENDGELNFTAHLIDSNFLGANSASAVDMDGDGDMDVLGSGYNANEIAWWENNGSQVFTKHTITDNLHSALKACAVDLDGDGDMDVLGAAYYNDQVAWWENDGSENFTQHIIDDYYYHARDVEGVDLDNDGDIDILITGYDGVVWWENDGSENFTERVIDESHWIYDVITTDLNNDGNLDILVAELLHGRVAWWESNGDGVFSHHIISEFDDIKSIFAADIDADGRIDVLTAADCGDDENITWWKNQNGLSFTKHVIDRSYHNAFAIHAADMDNDGDLDVLGSVHPGFGVDAVYLWMSDLDPEPEEPEPSTLEIHMVPDYVEVTVPQGGSFNYMGGLVNWSDEWVQTDVWTMIIMSCGYEIGPVGLWSDLQIEPYAIVHKYPIVQCVPPDAPLGNYKYWGYCGEYPFTVVDSTFFNFTVIDQPLSLGRDRGWAVHGWEDDEGVLDNMPVTLELIGNYPNPFNVKTNIAYALPDAGDVMLAVYNLLGQEVETLFIGHKEAGEHSAVWDASNYSTGTYFYKLSTGKGEILTRRMTLLK